LKPISGISLIYSTTDMNAKVAHVFCCGGYHLKALYFCN